MTDKQIIECKYKFQSIEKFAGKPYCTLHNEPCEFINFVCDKNCQVYEDYKQLKRKEQECEELKKANLHIENNREHKANKLNRIEKLILACTTGYTDEFIQELLVILHEPEPFSFENRYLQTLAEIKEIITTALEQNTLINLNKILQKINEVENVNNNR